MQINPVSFGHDTTFNATGRARLKTGATALAEVKHNEKGKIKELSVKILKDRQELGSFSKQWKRGIEYDRFLDLYWLENICKKLGIKEESEQMEVSDAIFEAEINEIESKCNKNEFTDTFPEDAYPDVYPNINNRFNDEI